MGLFGHKAVETPAEPAGRAVTLRDPGLPEHDLRQQIHHLFQGRRPSYVVYGPGTVDECFAALTAVAPAGRSSVVLPTGIAAFGADPAMPLAALSGPNGSAVAVFSTPACAPLDLKLLLVDPLRELAAPWAWRMVLPGAWVDSEAAAVIDDAVAVPLSELAAPARPGPASVIPELLRRTLVERGWEQVEADLFRRLVSTFDGRSQQVFVSTTGATAWTTSSSDDQL